MLPLSTDRLGQACHEVQVHHLDVRSSSARPLMISVPDAAACRDGEVRRGDCPWRFLAKSESQFWQACFPSSGGFAGSVEEGTSSLEELRVVSTVSTPPAVARAGLLGASQFLRSGDCCCCSIVTVLSRSVAFI